MTPVVMVAWPTGATPTVVSTSAGGTSSLGLATVTKPADLAAGNTLLLIFRNSTAEHYPNEAGWTQLFTAHEPTNQRISAWSKTVASDETATVEVYSSSSTRAGWNCYQFEGAVEFESAVALASLDPPELAPAAGSAAYLFLAVLGVAASDNSFANPAGYSNQLSGGSDASIADSRSKVVSARLAVTGTSENPSAWVASGTWFYPIAVTVSVRSTA